MKRLLIVLAGAAAACQTSTNTSTMTRTTPTSAPPAAASSSLPIAPDVAQRMAQLPRTVIDYDRSLLNDNERQVVAKLIEASKQIDEIYWRQVSEENPAWREQLAKVGGPAYDYFVANKGPWDRLKDDEPFVGATKKPAGAAFYPAD
ncbi:MAG: dipeptidyl-peptidase, partial [Thermoanaerobaculia bacterium]|nr:dipeptidyl-peptidase [Thermoanaerobaculia bacterium]